MVSRRGRRAAMSLKQGSMSHAGRPSFLGSLSEIERRRTEGCEQPRHLITRRDERRREEEGHRVRACTRRHRQAHPSLLRSFQPRLDFLL
eukprot:768799-Hanusia_phi.AAC.10